MEKLPGYSQEKEKQRNGKRKANCEEGRDANQARKGESQTFPSWGWATEKTQAGQEKEPRCVGDSTVHLSKL